MVPVSVRRHDERGTTGNRVSSLIVPLPLDELDPIERLERIVATTRQLKASGQSRGMQALSEAMEFSDTLTNLFARAARNSLAANLVVTNVPGPPAPIYIKGARLLEAYPVVPLAGSQALGVAIFSYAGTLYWGLNADWDRIPDLHDIALGIGSHFEALAGAVGAQTREASHA